MRVQSLCRLAAVAILAIAPVGAQQKRFYRLESSVVLPGAAPAWDYLALDPVHSLLFIGRRQAGVTVYDLAAQKVRRVIEESEGANATALVPEFDRGYTTNEDGTTTAFRLSNLETIGRIKFGDDADAAIYEPLSKQLAFMMGDSKAITFIDAEHGTVTGRVSMPSAKLDGAAVDGEGNLFVAERDRNSLARVSARQKRATAEWKVTGCEEPTGLAIDRANHRLLVGCRGARPVLAVMNSRTGVVVGTFTIGRGNDGVVYDPIRHQVLTSNGVDANLVIFNQVDADHYTLAEALTTRPFARTMAFNSLTQKIYLVTAEGTVDVAKKVNTAVSPFYPNSYFDDTFTLLTYSRR